MSENLFEPQGEKALGEALSLWVYAHINNKAPSCISKSPNLNIVKTPAYRIVQHASPLRFFRNCESEGSRLTAQSRFQIDFLSDARRALVGLLLAFPYVTEIVLDPVSITISGRIRDDRPVRLDLDIQVRFASGESCFFYLNPIRTLGHLERDVAIMLSDLGFGFRLLSNRFPAYSQLMRNGELLLSVLSDERVAGVKSVRPKALDKAGLEGQNLMRLKSAVAHKFCFDPTEDLTAATQFWEIEEHQAFDAFMQINWIEGA